MGSCIFNQQETIQTKSDIYFGLCNSLGIFQRIINSIFQELLYEEVLANYMDDFIISTKTRKELEKRTI